MIKHLEYYLSKTIIEFFISQLVKSFSKIRRKMWNIHQFLSSFPATGARIEFINILSSLFIIGFEDWIRSELWPWKNIGLQLVIIVDNNDDKSDDLRKRGRESKVTVDNERALYLPFRNYYNYIMKTTQRILIKRTMLYVVK